MGEGGEWRKIKAECGKRRKERRGGGRGKKATGKALCICMWTAEIVWYRGGNVGNLEALRADRRCRLTTRTFWLPQASVRGRTLMVTARCASKRRLKLEP